MVEMEEKGSRLVELDRACLRCHAVDDIAGAAGASRRVPGPNQVHLVADTKDARGMFDAKSI
jgi:hypothetical protein